ncbi:MAG TPA: farnesyl diphosphate synthase [Fimbriimonas sp.]|nr:farnesyl diphosphate synthase [Fimbriimonas sp.]
MDVESFLKSTVPAIEQRLQQLLPAVTEEPTVLHEAMSYSCLAPGKRLRPILTLLCAEAVGGKGAQALDAGCAIEMVHCFSLIHDDLPALDNDDLRRGVPTCHKKFGEAVAILAGDALFALAFDVLANQKASPEQVVRTMQVLTRSVGSYGLVGGETIDILSEGKPISAETLDVIHNRKTASLIGASCEIGAILGGGTPEQVTKLKTYGESIGLAFQIADDILNETGTPEQLGKSAGSDRDRQKATYPAIHGIENSRERALELVSTAHACVMGLDKEKELKALADFTVNRLR